MRQTGDNRKVCHAYATAAVGVRNGWEWHVSRRLYIHVGPRKTATSTIQQTLASHDNSVVFYPRVGRGLGGAGQAHGHHGLVHGFFGGNEDRDVLMDLLAAECRETDRDILLSAEIVDKKDIGALAQALLDRLNVAMDVEIIFACREHFSRAASLYNHRARRKKSHDYGLPDQFLAECASELCYAPLVRNLRRTGFAITALNYHPSSDWVERFLAHVGFSGDQMPSISSNLVAFSPKMLVAYLGLKEISSEERRREIRRAFSRIADARAPSGFIFGPDAAEVAEQQFAGDRQFLKDEFGIELVPPPPETRGIGLRIGAEEFADIAAVTEDFGAEGQAVADFASRFVR